MAKRTPDYTKQVRHEKVPARPAGGQRPKGRGRASVSDVRLSFVVSTYLGLAGGAAIYLFGCSQTVPYLFGANPRAYIAGSAASIAGLATNVLVGVLAVYAFYPRRFPLRRINKQYLMYAIIIFGVIALFYSFNRLLQPLATGLIPPVAIFYFILRPRLQEIAQAEGRYRPTKRDEALAEVHARREERRREKEAEKEYKRRLKARLARVDADEVGARRAARQKADAGAANAAQARPSAPPRRAGRPRPPQSQRAAGERAAQPGKDKTGPTRTGGSSGKEGGRE